MGSITEPSIGYTGTIVSSDSILFLLIFVVCVPSVLVLFCFKALHLLLLGVESTWAGVLAKGARTDDGRGNEEGDVMAAGVA